MSEQPGTAKPLAGRVAVVTGVSRRVGIGFAIAHRLGLLGADLFVHSWQAHDAAQPWGADPGGAEALVRSLRDETGSRVEHVEADFLDPAAPQAVIDAAASAYDDVGRLDILVANHARSGSGTIGTLTAEEIDAHLAVNVRATMLLVQAFALRREAGGGARPAGRVVLMTSGQHLGPMPGELDYAVSKGAVHQMTASFAHALVRRGIVLNTVNPGPTDTGYLSREEIEETTALFPQGRWGEPEDAARLVGWLCTDEAGWVVGQVINSEGGFRT